MGGALKATSALLLLMASVTSTTSEVARNATLTARVWDEVELKCPGIRNGDEQRMIWVTPGIEMMAL